MSVLFLLRLRGASLRHAQPADRRDLPDPAAARQQHAQAPADQSPAAGDRAAAHRIRAHHHSQAAADPARSAAATSRGNPAPPGDVLGAVGRELACSAGSWEHLTSAERARCGALSLAGGQAAQWLAGDGAAQYAAAAEAKRPIPSSPSIPAPTAIQTDLQRGLTPGQGGCPIMQNTPCLHRPPGMRRRHRAAISWTPSASSRHPARHER